MPIEQKCYVLDNGLTILQDVHWTQGITLLTTNKVWLLKGDPKHPIRSQYLTYNQPIWVVLYKYAHREFREYNSERVSFGSIMRRDKERCIYCNKRATTIDHIVPKSKGGSNIWRNLAACCWSCNQKKADRTPEEAGMKLLWTPDHVDFYAKEQKAVYKFIQDLSADEYDSLYRS